MGLLRPRLFPFGKLSKLKSAAQLCSITLCAAKGYSIKSENKVLSRVLRAAQIFMEIFFDFSILLMISFYFLRTIYPVL